MSTFKVDKEQVNDSVEILRKLLGECEEAYNKKFPESTQDKGKTHDELDMLCENLKTTCYNIGQLINNTILFLGKSSEMFEKSDKDSAAAIFSEMHTTPPPPGTGIIPLAGVVENMIIDSPHTGTPAPGATFAPLSEVLENVIVDFPHTGTPAPGATFAPLSEVLENVITDSPYTGTHSVDFTEAVGNLTRATGDINGGIKDANEVFEFIDAQYSEMPMWLREHIKSLAKETMGSSAVTSYDITQMLIEGDFEGAIEKFNKTLSGEAGNLIAMKLTGETDLSWDQKLLGKYYVNSVWGGVEAYVDYCKDPNLTTLGNVFWNSTVGSVFKTTGDQAYDVVSHIPGISDWYESKGATDMGSMFNVAYTEWTKTLFGKDTGDYVGKYYAENGGLYNGLVNGFSTIKDAVDEGCKKHGGLYGLWKSGWDSMFN